MINKTKMNYWIDIGLLITFLLVTITGIMKWPGLGVSRLFENIPWREMSLIHDWSGLIMAILVLVHIVLHWNWIIAMTKNYLGMNR